MIGVFWGSKCLLAIRKECIAGDDGINKLGDPFSKMIIQVLVYQLFRAVCRWEKLTISHRIEESKTCSGYM